MEESNITRVMGPKVHGAWNLHQASQAHDLDFFVLFSSVASMIGAAGQGSYVISNTWLDNFAHYRRSMGLPATAISWGALGEVGMAAGDSEVVAYFERVGLRPIKPGKAIDSFRRLLSWQQGHLGLVDVDWAAWGSYYPSWAKSPRYRHLVPEKEVDGGGVDEWMRLWLTRDEGDQVEEILQVLLPLVAKAMKLPVDKINPAKSLPELGIDSLVAMEMQTAIQSEMNVRVSTLELMKGNSLRKIAIHIRGVYLDTMDGVDLDTRETNAVAAPLETSQKGPASAPPSAATGSDYSHFVDSLNDDQLDDLLTNMEMI